jgi:ketosteroid isomerase-like protein
MHAGRSVVAGNISQELPMKTTIVVALCVALFTILPAAAQTSDRPVEKAIAAMEEKWAAAQRDGKADVVAPMIAENFVNTDTDGKVSGRSNLLSNLKGGKWEHNAISDVKVMVYGNTAVATGAWAGKGVDGDGTKIDRRERWTDTWVKMSNGQWQCVASQQTAVEKP